MLLEYNDNKWVDVDAITSLTYTDHKGYRDYLVGTVGYMRVTEEEYDVIVKAFRWRHPMYYKKDLSRGDK